MSTRALGQGLGTIAAGVAVVYFCWMLRKSDGFLTRTTDALGRSRLRSEQDRADLARGYRFALGFGVGLGVLVVLIGIGALS